MGTIWAYLFARLGEASTWRGIVMVLTAIGLQVSPEQSAAIITAGIAIAGLIGVFTKDKTSTGGTT